MSLFIYIFIQVHSLHISCYDAKVCINYITLILSLISDIEILSSYTNMLSLQNLQMQKKITLCTEQSNCKD